MASGYVVVVGVVGKRSGAGGRGVETWVQSVVVQIKGYLSADIDHFSFL